MKMMTVVKAVHKTLRDAGYLRQERMFVVGPKIYRSQFMYHSQMMVISIPGNWSIKLKDKYRRELVKVLEKFAPTDVSNSYAGVCIFFEQ